MKIKLFKNKKGKREKGQSLVEFAMVLPILLVLLGMAVDIARVIDAKILIQSAACESVRQITSRSTMTTEVNTVLSTYYDRIDSSKLVKNISGSSTDFRYYTYHAYNSYYNSFVDRASYIKYFDATVNLTYTVPIITPMAQLVMGKEKVISSQFTRMILEGGFSW